MPQHRARVHVNLRRVARRLQKEEIQGYRVDEGSYIWLAKEWAMVWARIRRDLEIPGEHPAGLTLFLFDMRML